MFNNENFQNIINNKRKSINISVYPNLKKHLCAHIHTHIY